MEYILTFFAGVITFISPCLLPIIPIYISYISLENTASSKVKLINSIGFSLGFSIVFSMLGAIFSTFSLYVNEYNKIISIVSGIIVITFGLSVLGVVQLKMPYIKNRSNLNMEKLTFFKSLIFGIIFAITMSPCLNTFLGSALLLSASSDNLDVIKGVALMLTFSLGLAIPFIITAMFIEEMEKIFSMLNKNRNKIQKISGIFMIFLGVLIFMGKINLITQIFD